MEYSKIIAVTGLPGLYELVNSKNDGAIIRSLDDKSTRFASSRIHNFSHLESIEIYTTGENVNMVEIFNAMEKAGGSLPDAKENDAVKKYFEKVYPELDFERVYTSDLKKMVKWFDVLKKNAVEIKLTEVLEEEEEATEQEEAKEEEVVVVASATKKPVAKKEAAPATKAKKPEPVKEEEPKKKAPVKAKKEEPAKAETKKPAAKKSAEKEEKPKAEKPKAAAKPKKESEDKTAKKKK